MPHPPRPLGRWAPEFMNNEPLLNLQALTRRRLLSGGAAALGTAALATLMGQDDASAAGGILKKTHFPAKAKRVIYLFQSGAPSQMDLFDWKPRLADLRATELPDSIRKG